MSGAKKPEKDAKDKSFEKGCKVDVGVVKDHHKEKEKCDALDKAVDGGDGPNKGDIQGG